MMKTTTRKQVMSLLGALGVSLASLSVTAAPEFPPLPEVTGNTVADKGTFEIKFSIGTTQSGAQYRGLEYFEKVVEQRSEGRIDVKLFHSAQLGDDLQAVSSLQAGTLEMTAPSTSPLVGMLPQLAVFDLPFLFPTPEDADRVLDGEVGQKMLKDASGQGFIAIGWAENGYRQLTNSKKAIQGPDDLAGLKVRTMQNPIHIDIWRTLGANPTPMSFAELFTALEQGVVDGQENPWITISASRFNEVQSHATETNHVYTPFMTLVSERFWKRLPAEYQALLVDASKEMATYQRQVSRSMNDQLKAEMKASNMSVTELSPEQIAAFQERLKPVYEKWKDKIGEDLLNSILKKS
ncbi:TRAP transporter substrate-binding protein [Stutzerimonas stutzeri]|uniref:TRAP transporter substrate-binding protein n=2 Tax=Stutzerimonas stutzeri TaxID=316 RepID=UPI00372334B8